MLPSGSALTRDTYIYDRMVLRIGQGQERGPSLTDRPTDRLPVCLVQLVCLCFLYSTVFFTHCYVCGAVSQQFAVVGTGLLAAAGYSLCTATTALALCFCGVTKTFNLVVIVHIWWWCAAEVMTATIIIICSRRQHAGGLLVRSWINEV